MHLQADFGKCTFALSIASNRNRFKWSNPELYSRRLYQVRDLTERRRSKGLCVIGFGLGYCIVTVLKSTPRQVG
ncbi:MAG: hypothetical protein QM784_40490 [Polyangiaceae bacterium]